jgi:hypothetical protein
MCCSSQSSPRVKLAKKISLALGLVLSLISFAQVAVADPASPAASATVPANPESLGITIFWAGAALFACVAAVGGIILARKLHQQKALVAAGGVAVPVPDKTFSLPANGNGKGNGSKPLRFNNRPAKTLKLNNNHANGNGNNPKRRRMFNYHKFYTEMVLQGPSPSSVADNAYNPYGGYYVEYEPPRSNHNGNGHNGSNNGNGNGNNGSTNGNGHHESNGAQAADLVANQKSLIQDQQRLIHEQARLIEEKSRLIAEKNQLLDRQSQMLDNNLL